jgi:hypothetical protein
MHIENYREKRKNGNVSFEPSASGRVAVLERKYDDAGVRRLVPLQESDSKDMAATIDHTEQQMAQLQAVLDDQKALATDIEAVENEAAKTAKEKAK